MASSHCIWIALFLFSVITHDIGVSGRAVDALGFLSQSQKTAEASGSTLPTDALRRWRRMVADKHRERCAELGAPWLENTEQPSEDTDENATILQLRVRPFSPGVTHGPVFPGKSLFSFVRRVYHCCQEGLHCGSVKGIQGRLRGDRDVEFLLTREILSLTVLQAELHLQLSNPQHLDIQPVLSYMAKRDLPTRYSLWSRGNVVELRVDLQFLFQSVQESGRGARGGLSLANFRQVPLSSRGGRPGERVALQDTYSDERGDGVVDTLPVLGLGLVLGCSQAGSGVSCRSGGVHLSHTPFMALYYK